MTESLIEKIFDDLTKAGLIRPNGCYRNGKPVYVAVPEAELTETAKARLNAMAKDMPS